MRCVQTQKKTRLLLSLQNSTLFWKPLGLILPSKEKQHSQPLPSSFFSGIKISSQPIERVRKACKTSCVLRRPRRCASLMCSVSDMASLSPLAPVILNTTCQSQRCHLTLNSGQKRKSKISDKPGIFHKPSKIRDKVNPAP